MYNLYEWILMWDLHSGMSWIVNVVTFPRDSLVSPRLMTTWWQKTPPCFLVLVKQLIDWEFLVKLSINDIMHARVHSTYLELCTAIWILWERHRVLTSIWTFFAKTVALMYFCTNAERVGRTWQVIADLPVVWTWSTCAKPNLRIDWRNRTQMYKVGRCFKWYK
mgnify:CR=1 FL=1